jgi:uncharacterized LabA/DUF88 family protein
MARVIKHKDQRVAVLIDTQNLYHSAKNLYKSKVNFAGVLDAAVGGRKLIRALSYVVNTESGEEQPFFEALEKIGIEIKTKDLQIFYGGAKKADWDVGLAVDAIKLSSKVDAIVLATGDGDFIPLVEYLKSQGCQVEGITFGRSASSKFREIVDDFIDMDENPNDYIIGFRPQRGGNSQGKRRPNGKQNGSLRKQIQKVVGTDTDNL